VDSQKKMNATTRALFLKYRRNKVNSKRWELMSAKADMRGSSQVKISSKFFSPRDEIPVNRTGVNPLLMQS